jgi:ribosome-binding protein aMBF1 (putative translation factor)
MRASSSPRRAHLFRQCTGLIAAGVSFDSVKRDNMEDINSRVGFNIRRAREEKGLTQEELGNQAGLHRAYIGQIERGEKNIGIRNLERITTALGVTIQDLLDVSPVDDSQTGR